MLFLKLIILASNNNNNNRLKHIHSLLKRLYAYVYLLSSTRKPRKIQPKTSTVRFIGH